MDFEPSPYQKAIFDFVESGADSAIVEAVAGSGKTTTIVKALERIPQTKEIIFLAFNKSIQEELSNRVPKHVQVLTTHSLGLRAITSAWGRVKVDGNKKGEIIKEVLGDVPRFLWNITRAKVGRTFSLAKSSGIVPGKSSHVRGLLPDDRQVWDALFEHHDILDNFDLQEMLESADLGDDQEYVVNLTRKALSLSIINQRVIDFDDMLYLPTIFNLPLPAFDVIMVDEAQDIAPIQLHLISRALRKDGRVIAVGDPHQAIYGFRGADSEALENIRKRFDATCLPLSISYRCPRKVVEAAQRYVGHIQSSPTAPEGTVETPEKMKLTDFKPRDFILCRFKAPVIGMAYKFIRAKIPVKVLGRDIGAGLIATIESFKARDFDDLRNKLEQWYQKSIAQKYRKDPDADTSEIDDKKQVIETMLDMTTATNIPQLLMEIEALFSEQASGTVILSTIHKAKGLEAERVFWLDSDKVVRAKKDWQQEQENNLKYVAVTRSKSYLGFIYSGMF